MPAVVVVVVGAIIRTEGVYSGHNKDACTHVFGPQPNPTKPDARGLSLDISGRPSIHSFSRWHCPFVAPCVVPRNQFNIWSFCTRPASRGVRRGIADTADEDVATQYRPSPGASQSVDEGDARQALAARAKEQPLPRSGKAHTHRAVIMSVPVPRILKKKHFRVKHQKVKIFRANEPLVSVFMWGINHTVSQCDESHAQSQTFAFIFIWTTPRPPQINELSHVNIPVMLLPDDFRAFSKIKVDNHLFNK